MSYQRLIENTFVPSLLSSEEKNTRYSSVLNTVNQMKPSKLYRFRNCSERSISAFLKDELWFSNGSSMNDDFDARLYYDKKKIINWLDSFVAEDGCLKVLNQIANMDAMPNEFCVLASNADQVFNVLKNMSKDQSKIISTQIVEYIKNNLDISLKDITHKVQSGTKFACFSEKIYSDMMWGHYADNGTGFSLEYEFGPSNVIKYQDDSNSQSIVWANLFPIIYGNQRLDTTAYAIYLFQNQLLMNLAQKSGMQLSQQWLNAVVPFPDEFMTTKLAIKKSSDWKIEKEWRLFYTTNDINLANQQHSNVKQKPSALFLGRKISELNQKVLVDIAREKEIPVFKMDFNDNSKTYRLRKYRLKI